MQNKPRQNDFNLGLIIKFIIAGREKSKVNAEEKKTNVFMLNVYFHLMNILLKHQNVATYN